MSLFSKEDAYNRMWELLDRDHGGCEEDQCSLAEAMRNGEDFALEIWHDSGGADEEFIELYQYFYGVKQ